MLSTKDYTTATIVEYMQDAYFEPWGLQDFQGASACLWFEQASTRTYLSFDKACKELGFITSTVPLNSSSNKGEDAFRTAETIDDMGYDVLVIRHPVNSMAGMIRKRVGMKVINAGDGTREHPTQALADLYTLIAEFSHFKRPDLIGLKVAVVGDVVYSRVAHSLIPLLDEFGVNVKLVDGPQRDWTFINERLPDIEDAVAWADVVYMLRPQDGTYNTFAMTNQFRSKHFDKVKLMHPGPVIKGQEVEFGLDLNHKNSLVSDQVKNGVRVRKAVLAGALTW